MAQTESRQMTSTLLRLAIHLGQPLASREPSKDWFKRLVEAVTDISGAAAVRVYFAGQGGQPYLRVAWQINDVITLFDEVATDPQCLEAYNQKTVIFADSGDDTTIYLPIRHQTAAVGVLQVVSPDETGTAFTVLEALDVLASFAACGFTQQMGGVQERHMASQMIERTRAKALNELSAAVAHQINNPLTTILADTEILLLDTDPDSKAYESLEAIARAGRRAADVARRLMSVSKPDKLEGTPQPIDVLGSIEDVLLLIHRYIEHDNIAITKNYPENLPSVWAAPGVLGDVWLNLLMNARDALQDRQDARIIIDVVHNVDANEICVSITDNGMGVPDVAKAHLFEPFFTIKPSAEHMGLGLHICRQIVEQVGGRIFVADNTDDTCFVVCLPVEKGS